MWKMNLFFVLILSTVIGEYMAGGLVLVFVIGKNKAVKDRGIGSGIHGREIGSS